MLFKSIPALALCAFVLGACTQELEAPAVQNDHFGEATDVEPSPIAFSSQAFDATKTGEELPAVPLCTFKDASDGAQTKTTLSGSTLYWANGDGIAVYEYLSGTLKQNDLCTTTSTSTTGSFTPVTSAKQQNTSWMRATGSSTETYDFYSYYPASGDPATPSDGAVSLSNVAATQAGTLDGIGQYLICYGVDSKTRAQIAAGTYPTFAFEPNVAILHVTLTNSTGVELSNFQNFSVTANGDTGIVGAASLNLSTGVLTPSADTKTVTCSASSSTFADDGTKEYYFAVMPSESATTLSFAASATNAYFLTMADHSLSGGIFGGYIYNIAVSISAVINEIALSDLKSLINSSGDVSTCLGWEVNSSGYASPSVSGTKIGYIGYMSTSDVDTDVSGSRILVIASADASTGAAWGSYGTPRGLTTDNMCGYSYTNTLQGYGSSAHPAAYAAWNYSATIPSGGSTPAHWFMPTKAQLSAIMSALGGYSTFKTTVGWSSATYWTSTENDAHYAWYYFDNGWFTYTYSKNYSYYVRACFAY